MAKYEMLYVISPDLNDEEKDALIDKFKKYVEDNKGSVAGVDKWGNRVLAYPIKFKKEGFYVLMNFELGKEETIALGKLMLITDNVLRHIIVCKD